MPSRRKSSPLVSEDQTGKEGRHALNWYLSHGKVCSLTFEEVPEEEPVGQDLSVGRRPWLPLCPDRISAEIQFCVFHWCHPLASLGQRIARICCFKCEESETSRRFLLRPLPPPRASLGWLVCLTPFSSPCLLLSLSLRCCFSGLAGAGAESGQSQA